MAEVHWGVDGRRHRVGPNGQTLCRTMIDYSRPPEERVLSGCQVCDIVVADIDAPGAPVTGRALAFAVALAVLVGALLWAVLR